MRHLRILSAVLTFLGALALAAPSANAAQTYTLRWSAPNPNTLLANTSLPISWTKSAAAAPALARAAAGNGACRVETTRTAFGTLHNVKRGKVADGRLAEQKCPVTVQGGTNANFVPSPAVISHNYQALSYEPIKFDNFIPGFADKLWCVSKCNFVAGAMTSVFRQRSTGYCYGVQQSYVEGAGRADGGHGSFAVECPQTVKLKFDKKLYSVGKTFSVTATSNLGIDVKVTSKTPSVCSVKKTDTTPNHSVKALKAGKCTLTVTSPRSTQNDHPFGGTRVYMYGAATPVTGSTKIGKCKKNCGEDDLLEQSIAHAVPGSSLEYDVISVLATATSNLPVDVEVVNVNRCAYDPATRELQMMQHLLTPNPADLNQANICRIELSQAGSDDHEPADDVFVDIVITCSPDITCPPPPPTPPVANPDMRSVTYDAAGRYSGTTRGNDTIPAGFEAFTIVTQSPSSGSLDMNPTTGEYSFSPSNPYFVGTMSFAYKLVATNGTESPQTTATLTVDAPSAPPPPPTPSTAVTVQAGKWMRLNTTESITAAASGSCGTIALTNGVCGTHPDAGGIVGSYNRFTKVELTAFEPLAPAGYPSNRWSVVTAPTVGTPSSVFSTGVSAKLRFQQATATNASFTVKFGFKLTWQSVQWTRFNGVLVETVADTGVTISNAQSSFGVIGSTS